MRLDPADIEAIARRVAQLLPVPQPAEPFRYVDAAAVARVLEVDRQWVYAHAEQLGAIRLGGPCGRLRFDLREVQRALAEERPRRRNASPAPASRRSRRGPPARVDLLPYES